MRARPSACSSDISPFSVRNTSANDSFSLAISVPSSCGMSSVTVALSTLASVSKSLAIRFSSYSLYSFALSASVVLRLPLKISFRASSSVRMAFEPSRILAAEESFSRIVNVIPSLDIS